MSSRNGTNPAGGTHARDDRLAGRLLDLDRLAIDADQPLPFRCDGLAVDGFLTILAAVGGAGKSLLTAALGGGVLRGDVVAGITCRRGAVLIVDAENGARLIARRLRALDVPLNDGLEIYDGHGLDLARAEDVEAIITAIARLRDRQTAGDGVLAIFDSIRRLSPRMRENDSDSTAVTVAALATIARRTGAAVIAVHHRGRGEGDYRGSSALRDQTDLMFVLEAFDKDPQRGRRRLRCIKNRLDVEPPARWLELVADAGHVQFIEAAPRGVQLPQQRSEIGQKVLAALADGTPRKRPDIAREVGKDPKDGTLRRAIDDLVTDGHINRVDGGLILADTEGATVDLAPNGTPGTQPEAERVPCHPSPEGGGTWHPDALTGATSPDREVAA